MNMKKVAGVCIIIGCVFTIAGIICLIIGGANTNFDFSSASDMDFEKKTFEFEGELSTLDLLTISDSIIVKHSPDKKTRLEYFNSTDGKITYDIKRTYDDPDEKGKIQLKAEQKDNRQWFEYIKFFNFSKDNALTVYLPQENFERVQLQTVSGEISSEIKLSSKSSFHINTTSGDIKAGNISTVSAFEVNAVSGCVTMKNVSSGTDIKINTVSGNITASDCDAKKNFSISTTSGESSLSKAKSDSADLSSISGDFSIDVFDTKRLNVSTISGEIEGRMGSDGVYNTDTVSGDINVPASAGSERNYSFETVSGNIDLK